ncbi:g311 [Coccomyxa viridis]|uniref:G311 protein n=1 Tax=Coccomyxa viridis TaxID=1274662 RepID=A0ABP1FM49_9CHLO
MAGADRCILYPRVVLNADGTEKYWEVFTVEGTTKYRSTSPSALPGPLPAPFKASKGGKNASAAQLDLATASQEAKRPRTSMPECSCNHDVQAERMRVRSTTSKAAAEERSVEAHGIQQAHSQENEEALAEAYRIVGMVGAEALAEAYRIVGSDPLYEAAGRSLGAAYKVWSHEKPKRVPDKRSLDVKLKIFDRNAGALRQHKAKYPEREVSLNRRADLILYDRWPSRTPGPVTSQPPRIVGNMEKV